MLKILLRKQMGEIFRSYYYDAKKSKARSKAATAAYMVLFVLLLVLVLGGMFTLLSLFLCGAMLAAKMQWLYFAIMGLLAILLGVFGSVFNTYAGLYLAKDNDQLLSLPIPVRDIIASRLLSVYLMGLMYSGVVLLPAIVVYWVLSPFSLAALLAPLWFLVLISVFVLTLSCLLGFVVAKISLRLKNKSFITVLVSLLFFGAYYFFYFKAQTLIEQLLANLAAYGGAIQGKAYPVYLIGKAGEGNLPAVLAVSAVVLALFALTWRLLARSFIKIATTPGSAAKRAVKGGVAQGQKTVNGALFGKEVQRFTSSANYMLNCGLGILFCPVGGVMFLLKGKDLVTVLQMALGLRASAVPVLLAGVICLLSVMNNMAAPSISLEGKTLWQLQSLPVRPWQVLRAKLLLQLTFTAIPVLFCLLCTLAAYRYTPLQFVLTALAVLLFVLLTALFDLFLGLKMPNLTWTNETTPIKQSASVALALLAGFAYPVLVLAGYFLLSGFIGGTLYLGLAALLSFALCLPLFGWLKRRGGAVFAAL